MKSVCVCVPVFNASKTLPTTLESILNQTYKNISIFIVDNASTDNTVDIAERYAEQHKNIKIFDFKENITGEGNFTRCIQLAEGDYTAIYHSDDVYKQYMVEQQAKFLEAYPEAGAVFTGADIINQNEEIIGAIRLPKDIVSGNRMYNFEKIFKAVLQHSNFFICSSAMAQTEVYKKEIKRWREDLFCTSSDLDVWFRILKHHPIGILNESLMNYRISEGQGSALVRMSTNRADFFSVIDYYLKCDEVKAMLTLQDLRNYSWLERRDRVMRAVNFFLIDQHEEAKKLCYDICSSDAVHAALQTRRGLIVIILGLYLKLLISCGMNKFGKMSLAYMKKITNK